MAAGHDRLESSGRKKAQFQDSCEVGGADTAARGFIRSKNVADHSFAYGLKVLDAALAMGRQADRLGPDAVRIRMDAVQERAPNATSMADGPIFAVVKRWLERKKKTELA